MSITSAHGGDLFVVGTTNALDGPNRNAWLQIGRIDSGLREKRAFRLVGDLRRQKQVANNASQLEVGALKMTTLFESK